MPKPRKDSVVDKPSAMVIVGVTAKGIKFKVLDDRLWEEIKAGKYDSICIGGVAYAEAA